MILTAIVISFGLTGFLLALAYRSWQLTGADEVEDDLEDARIARASHQRAAREPGPVEYDDTLPSEFPADRAGTSTPDRGSVG